MLQFWIGKYLLDLPLKTSVDFEFSQPAFTEEFIKGSGSYDIDLPRTPTNDKALAFAHNLSSNAGMKLYDIKVDFGANTIINGTLSLWEANEKSYKVTVEKSEIPFLINKLSIRELDWDPIDMGSTTQDVIDYALAAGYKDDDSYPVRFPEIHAPNWYGDKNELNTFFRGVVNEYDEINDEYFVNEISVNYLENNKYSLLPCVTYFAVLKQIAKQFGYLIVGTALDHYEIKNLSFLNNFSLDKMGDSFPMNTPVSQYVTADAGDNNGTVISGIYTPQEIGTHLFSVVCTQALEAGNCVYHICYDNAGVDTSLGIIGNNSGLGEFELKFEYYVTDLATDLYICAYKTNPNDGDPLLNGDAKIENIGWNHLNVYDTQINIANHLPPISVDDFLVLYKTQACLNIDFDKDNSTILFNLREDLLQSEIKNLEHVNPDSINKTFNLLQGYRFAWNNSDAMDFTSDKYEGEFNRNYNLPVANDVNQYAFVKADQAYYKVEYDEDTKRYSWQWYAAHNPSYLVGDTNLNDIKLGANLASMIYNSNSICIYQQEQGYSVMNPDAEKIDDVTVFIYHGYILDVTRNKPMGSTNSWDYLGENLNSLQLNETKGLWNWRLKEWYQVMVDTDEISMQVYLKSPQIKELFSKRWYFDGIVMLIKDLDLSIDSKSILPTEITLRKLG